MNRYYDVETTNPCGEIILKNSPAVTTLLSAYNHERAMINLEDEPGFIRNTAVTWLHSIEDEKYEEIEDLT